MEKEINEQIFADGFNKGYWLYTYEEEVAKSFIKNEVAIYDDFSAGFAKGLQQAEQEKTLSEFEQLRNSNKEQEQNLERQ